LETYSNNRALRAVKKLNQIKRKNSQKIDILCNDMVGMQKDIIDQLGLLTFTVNFYESITGQTDISNLLDIASEHIRGFVKNSNVAVFLLETGGFELHMADDSPIEFDGAMIESYFTPEVVNEISRSNRICSLNDMCEMGLQGNPAVLNKISAAAVPLGRFAEPVGFILLCRGKEEIISAEELRKVATISGGLRKAIVACQSFDEATAIE
jgi:hypothetical protein